MFPRWWRFGRSSCRGHWIGAALVFVGKAVVRFVGKLAEAPLIFEVSGGGAEAWRWWK